MRLRMYSLLDKAVQAYHPPFCFRAQGEAHRSFRDAVTNDKNIAANKGDYAFCFIGWFDDNKGACEPNPLGPIIELEAATVLAEPLGIFNRVVDPVAPLVP